MSTQNFNPRSSCEERQYCCGNCKRAYYNFNPRSSCEERRRITSRRRCDGIFQSTLLMRGATVYKILQDNTKIISIHAPHARSDWTCWQHWTGCLDFNPRSSCEERLAEDVNGFTTPDISIHAPHARSDKRDPPAARRGRDFNPRSSCEERLIGLATMSTLQAFQSTLLMRGATKAQVSVPKTHFRFQSTLLMRGATPRHRVLREPTQNFNPRSSCEERPQKFQT